MELKKVKPEYSRGSFGDQVWQHLKRKYYKKLGKYQEVPWMAQKERDILEEAILRLSPATCLEWGSGFSTLTFPLLLNGEAKWLSIEHNEEWYQMIAQKNLSERVDLNHIGSNNEEYQENDGSYDDFQDYIEFPKRKFDFILIDGRARNHCLKRAYELIDDNGLVVLHDANRLDYHKNISMFEYQELFMDHRRTFGGIWLGSKSCSIGDILDIEHHRTLWDHHFFLLRFIRPFAKRSKN